MPNRRAGVVISWVRKLLHVRDTPEALARGLAVGFFFGVSFFWGLQIVLAVLVSHLARGNKVVAAAMTAISNPLTSLPLYTLCYFVGHLILGGNDAHPDFARVQSLEGFLALGPRFFLTMLIGTTAVGLVGGVIVYLSSQRLLATLRRWHRRRGGQTDRHDEGASGEGQGAEGQGAKEQLVTAAKD